MGARIKINPRWQAAPFEQTLVWDKKVYKVLITHKIQLPTSPTPETIKDPYPYRFETVADWEKFLEERKREYAVPWFLVEQSDGTWKESF